MIHEYAIEPACFGDWGTFRYLAENLGVSQGRLVSWFSKEWKNQVRTQVGSWSGTVSFRDRGKQIEDALKQLQRALVKSGRNYDGSKTWLENAIAQQSIKPFRAVIAKQDCQTHDFVLSSDFIDKNTALWAVERERKVQRTVDALGDAVAPLLRISERVLFIDKMFHPVSERWRDVLKHLMQISSNGREKPPLFEYHCGVEKDKGCQQQDEKAFHADCQRCLLPILLPSGNLTITRWDQNRGGDFFHDRYVLTEKGGVRVGWGLDSGKAGETTDMCLLDDFMHSQLWSAFQSDANLYSLIDTITMTQKDR